jgi:hypothetical protein
MKHPPASSEDMPREEFSRLWAEWHERDIVERIQPLGPWQQNLIKKIYLQLGYRAACDTLEGWETL